MGESINEMLRKDMQCEGLLECFHDLKGIDKEVFQLLDEQHESLTVDEIAAQVDRERSTAYRSVQRLLSAGYIQKEQVNYEQGGYHHVYSLRDGDEIAQQMQRTLNDWYAEIGGLIGEFTDKYDDDDSTSHAPAEC
jgi:predicted transcriptional regulator